MKPKLDSTTEYEVFDLHELNRNLHDSTELEESMRKYGFRPSSPIHVTRNGGGKLKVKRGHNRLAVAMKLKLPVWYIIDDDPMSIYEWEGDSHHLWNAEDFATSYMRGGSEDCKTLLDFRKKHGLTLGAAASLVGGESAGSKNKVKQVKAGTFAVGDMKHALSVAKTIDLCKESGVEFATSTGFVAALSAAVRVPEFDIETFKSRVRLYPKMMSRRTSKADYLVEIEAIYNYGARGKRLAVAVRAHEVSLERQRTFGGTKGSAR
ncbi:MAG: hypothetical protein FJ272_21935 [Planctomycetes bacterium]|nr:hypothetical protein [Planctomycetota bacterium]